MLIVFALFALCVFDKSYAKSEKLLDPENQSILYIESNGSGFDRQKEGYYRFVVFHPKIKSNSTSLLSATIQVNDFSGQIFPSWIRYVEWCYKRQGFFTTTQFLRLVEPDVNVASVDHQFMDTLFSACDMVKRLHNLQGPMTKTETRQSLVDNLASKQQTVYEKREENLDHLMTSVTANGSNMVFLENNDESNKNPSRTIQPKMIVVHTTASSSSSSSLLLKSSNVIQRRPWATKVDFCRIFNRNISQSYLLLRDKIVTHSLSTNSISELNNLCNILSSSDSNGLPVNTLTHSLSSLIVPGRVTSINIMEIDEKSWQTKGKQTLLVQVHLRSKPRPFSWLIDNPDHLPSWALNIDRCEIYSHPELITLFLSGYHQDATSTDVIHLVDRQSIKTLVNVCDYVNLEKKHLYPVIQGLSDQD